MSYILVDSKGLTADLASNSGMAELDQNGPPLLRKLLHDGSIAAGAVHFLIGELSTTNYGYIANALRRMKGDVIVSNGVVDESVVDDTEESIQISVDESYPGHPGRRGIVGGSLPRSVGAVAKRQGDVDTVLKSYPKHLTDGITKIQPTRIAGRSFYDNGEINLDMKNFSPTMGYISSDMTGERVVSKDYAKTSPTFYKGVKTVDNLGSYLLQQTTAHEIGHHVMNMLSDDQKATLAKILNKNALKVSTHTAQSYREYFSNRVDEVGGHFKFFANRRVAHEAFAESVRLKATDKANYLKRVPVPIRKFIDTIWKTPKS